MTLFSMTGFGQAVAERGGVRVKVEIRTVNHRFAEFNTRMPRELLQVDEEVRAYVARRISRGRSDVFVSIEEASRQSVRLSVDWATFDALCDAERQAVKRLGLSTDQPVSHVQWLQYPEVLQVHPETSGMEELRAALLDALERACDELTAMRSREGSRLQRDFVAKIAELRQIVGDLQAVASVVEASIRQKLQLRLKELMVQFDEQRVLTEAALYAEKSSIDEELVRLASHLLEFETSLGSGSPVGRRLDFIVQEMNREVNTIGSKSSDIRVSKAVVNAKTLIEQLREQVQNIE